MAKKNMAGRPGLSWAEIDKLEASWQADQQRRHQRAKRLKAQGIPEYLHVEIDIYMSEGMSEEDAVKRLKSAMGRARRNMAGRPGRLGLPRYEGPRPEGYAKFGKKDLRDMASSGDQLAAMELEWRKQDRAMRSGLLVPERVVKRPAQPPQVTAFAPGFSAVPAVSDRGQQVFRILLHGRPIPTEKMPEGRFSLSMEGAAAMSHKLDPQTGERLRFGKTKSQRRGSKAAANPWWQE